MRITSVTQVNDHDVEAFAWRRIAQFQNIDYTAQLIMNLHKLDKKHLANAKKQAEQVKYCLTQAREYFDASKRVSLATKPVQQYYCLMSLALAEILVKQTAESRLSALRANHNCHGLTFSLTSEPNVQESLASTAVKFYAKPQFGSNGKAKGTFEVWRRSARESPIGGEFIERHLSGQTKSFKLLFVPSDEPPPVLPSSGINLYQCLTNLPYMAEPLSRWGLDLRMVRGVASKTYNTATQTTTTSLTIHPNTNENIEAFGNLCKFEPSCINHLRIHEFPSGYTLSWDQGIGAISLPHATCISTEDVYFTCSSEGFGEFGHLYLSLHMIGNYARYYPDKWIKHIEVNSPLASVVDDLCRYAMERLPLLALSELARSYYVKEK